MKVEMVRITEREEELYMCTSRSEGWRENPCADADLPTPDQLGARSNLPGMSEGQVGSIHLRPWLVVPSLGADGSWQTTCPVHSFPSPRDPCPIPLPVRCSVFVLAPDRGDRTPHQLLTSAKSPHPGGVTFASIYTVGATVKRCAVEPWNVTTLKIWPPPKVTT